MIVLDASAALEWLLQTNSGRQIGERMHSEIVHIPHLLDLEITQGLRRSVLQGNVSAQWAEAALQVFIDARFIRHRHWPLLRRVWHLRQNLTPYDAVYIALAELLAATLLTHDRKLSGAHGHQAEIELL